MPTTTTKTPTLQSPPPRRMSDPDAALHAATCTVSTTPSDGRKRGRAAVGTPNATDPLQPPLASDHRPHPPFREGSSVWACDVEFLRLRQGWTIGRSFAFVRTRVALSGELRGGHYAAALSSGSRQASVVVEMDPDAALDAAELMPCGWAIKAEQGVRRRLGDATTTHGAMILGTADGTARWPDPYGVPTAQHLKRLIVESVERGSGEGVAAPSDAAPGEGSTASSTSESLVLGGCVDGWVADAPPPCAAAATTTTRSHQAGTTTAGGPPPHVAASALAAAIVRCAQLYKSPSPPTRHGGGCTGWHRDLAVEAARWRNLRLAGDTSPDGSDDVYTCAAITRYVTTMQMVVKAVLREQRDRHVAWAAQSADSPPGSSPPGRRHIVCATPEGLAEALLGVVESIMLDEDPSSHLLLGGGQDAPSDSAWNTAPDSTRLSRVAASSAGRCGSMLIGYGNMDALVIANTLRFLLSSCSCAPPNHALHKGDLAPGGASARSPPSEPSRLISSPLDSRVRRVLCWVERVGVPPSAAAATGQSAPPTPWAPGFSDVTEWPSFNRTFRHSWKSIPSLLDAAAMLPPSAATAAIHNHDALSDTDMLADIVERLCALEEEDRCTQLQRRAAYDARRRGPSRRLDSARPHVPASAGSSSGS